MGREEHRQCRRHRRPAVRCDGGRRRLDEVLRALSAPRCRRLAWLAREAGVADLEELAGRIAATEVDLPPAEVPEDRRAAVLIDLHHNHLPKLADLGVLEYDDRSRVVRYGEPPAPFEALVERSRELEGPD